MLLKAHRMTHKELAQKINVPLKTLEGWKYFDRIPGTQIVYNMAVTLGVSSNYLLGGEEKDIAYRRLRELAARDTLTKMEAMLQDIMREAGKIKALSPRPK